MQWERDPTDRKSIGQFAGEEPVHELPGIDIASDPGPLLPRARDLNEAVHVLVVMVWHVHRLITQFP
jgi:hypothetical protein